MSPLRQAGRRAAPLAPPPASPHVARCQNQQCHPPWDEPFFSPIRHLRLPLLWAGVRARMISTSIERHDCIWKAGMASRFMQTDIVNALRKGDRQRASIMLSNLQQIKEELTSEDFSYILEYCAEAPDPLFVMETLELMNLKAIDISKSNYRFVTRALSEGGCSKEVKFAHGHSHKYFHARP